MRYVNAGVNGNVWALTNSGLTGSRLGFRGTEDLGGGLSASFWLEAGLNNDNGTGSNSNINNAPNAVAPTGTQGLTFNRRSTWSAWPGAGVNCAWAATTCPRSTTSSSSIPSAPCGAGANAIFSYGGMAALTGNVLNITNAGIRASNSISYLMPNIGGFYG